MTRSASSMQKVMHMGRVDEVGGTYSPSMVFFGVQEDFRDVIA